jgi:hypothetical protein
MNIILKNARDHVNVITLHDKTHDQSLESGHCLDDHEDEKFKERRYVSDEMHLFKECLYIVIAARKPG